MTSLAAGLPPEIAAQIHPDWHANEAAYWASRDELLAAHRGLWVAFAGGRVLASASSAVEVFQAADAFGLHPFVIRVGAEDEPCRMRRASFPYDAAYPDEPLPLLDLEFRAVSGATGVLLDRVIPDTGADASALPWPDCQTLGLDPARGVPGLIGGGAVRPRRSRSSHGCGWTAGNIRVSCRRTSAGANASWAGTC